jgi:hypothetical protein
MPIEYRKDKRSFNQGKTQQMLKVRYHKKKKKQATNMIFGIHDKAPNVII